MVAGDGKWWPDEARYYAVSLASPLQTSSVWVRTKGAARTEEMLKMVESPAKARVKRCGCVVHFSAVALAYPSSAHEGDEWHGKGRDWSSKDRSG